MSNIKENMQELKKVLFSIHVSDKVRKELSL